MRTLVSVGVVAGLVLAAVATAMANSEDASSVAAVAGELIVYGDAPSTFGRLWVPAGQRNDPAPTVVMIHGGFWRRSFGLETTDALSARLAGEGYAVWNIEYGRVGERLGGWPHTFDHVTAAVEFVGELADEHRLDPSEVAVVGHSAGGHLALWVSGNEFDRVDLRLAVGLGAIVDIELAAADGLGNGAVLALLDAPDPLSAQDRLDHIRPRPVVPVTLINGARDDIVPNRYSVPVGFDADIRRLEAEDHFGLIAPDGEAVEVLLGVLHSR